MTIAIIASDFLWTTNYLLLKTTYSMMSSISMGDFISPTGSNLSPMENSALRVSHEHTDSGLGADQDYAYSSER